MTLSRKYVLDDPGFYPIYETRRSISVSFEVSGWAVIGVLRAIKRQWGSGTVAEFVKQMSPDFASVFSTPLHASSTYPESCLTALMEVAERNKGMGAAAKIGQGSGFLAVEVVFPIYQQILSNQRFLKSFPHLWEKMTNGAGRFEITKTHDSGATVCLFDYPDMPELWCRFLGGWLVGAVQSVGNKKGVEGMEVACPRTGGSHHEYELRWFN